MLTLHHLNDSRSQRILWLLEELGTPYEMKRYQRNAETRLAPPELKEVHPLGKSPVITDGDTTIAESAAIVDYIIRRYGKGAMMPAPGSADYEAYSEWLHYSEGSAMLPLMLNLYVGRLKEAGAPLHPRIDSELANHLGYVDAALKGREFFVGPSLTGADIQMSFVGEMAKVFGKLDAIPEPRGLAGPHARPPGVPAQHRKGRGIPVCVIISVSFLRTQEPIRRGRRNRHLGRGLRLPMTFRGYGPRLLMRNCAFGPGRRQGGPGQEPPSSPPYLA